MSGDKTDWRSKVKIPEQEAYVSLTMTVDRLSHVFDSLLRTHGISQPQYNVLRIIRGAAPDSLPCQQIADRMITRVPDITRLLDRLAKQKLVSRDRSREDRRVVLVKLTKEGFRLLESLDEPITEIHRQQVAHLTKQELEQLMSLLARVREGLPER